VNLEIVESRDNMKVFSFSIVLVVLVIFDIQEVDVLGWPA